MNNELKSQIAQALTLLNKGLCEHLTALNEGYQEDDNSVYSLALTSDEYADIVRPYLEAVTLLRRALKGGDA